MGTRAPKRLSWNAVTASKPWPWCLNNSTGTQSFDRLDLTQYFHDLVKNLVAAYRSQGEPIAFTVQATGISLELDKAIPGGLIVTELVSNCLKYAFPANTQGHITIGLAQATDQQYRLWVQDTGVGFPKDLDYRNLNSLGLQLVIDLSEHQLGGTLTMENTNGTTMTVMFPI